jgi:hypothetical protein
MSDEHTPSPDPSTGRHRRAPTIDLEAKEIASEPVADEPGRGGDAAASEPPPQPDGRQGRERGRFSVWSVAAGLVAGAGLVALGMWLNASFNPPAASDLSHRLTQLEGQMRTIAERTSRTPEAPATNELAARIARLESALNASGRVAADPALSQRLEKAEKTAGALAESVAQLGRRADDAARQAREALARADAAATRADAAQTDADRQQAQAMTDRHTRLAVAALALHGAVARGDAFTAELEAVRSLAADPTVAAPLDNFAVSGIPSAASLARELEALIPSLYRAADATGEAAGASGVIERLQVNARRLVRIRPLDQAPPGEEPTYVIARIEMKAKQTDIAGAGAELAKLPDSIRAPANAWIEKAQRRTTALAAARQVLADALAKLEKSTP